jgi:predicted phage-related endonuclease
MKATIIVCDQRSEQWTAARVGRVGSSDAKDMLATVQKGEAAARRNLRVKLALERITGRSMDRQFQSQAMLDGVEREGDALAAYEALTGSLVERVGYVSLDDLMAGASPDGVINGFEGIAEAKCPTAPIHLDYLRTGVIPTDYQRQVLHQLYVTGAQWCDWLSYQPDFPEPLRVKLVRVTRDEAQIADYEKKLIAFLAEVDREVEAIATLTNLRGQLEAAAS